MLELHPPGRTGSLLNSHVLGELNASLIENYNLTVKQCLSPVLIKTTKISRVLSSHSDVSALVEYLVSEAAWFHRIQG